MRRGPLEIISKPQEIIQFYITHSNGRSGHKNAPYIVLSYNVFIM